FLPQALPLALLGLGRGGTGTGVAAERGRSVPPPRARALPLHRLPAPLRATGGRRPPRSCPAPLLASDDGRRGSPAARTDARAAARAVRAGASPGAGCGVPARSRALDAARGGVKR